MTNEQLEDEFCHFGLPKKLRDELCIMQRWHRETYGENCPLPLQWNFDYIRGKESYQKWLAEFKKRKDPYRRNPDKGMQAMIDYHWKIASEIGHKITMCIIGRDEYAGLRKAERDAEEERLEALRKGHLAKVNICKQFLYE